MFRNSQDSGLFESIQAATHGTGAHVELFIPAGAKANLTCSCCAAGVYNAHENHRRPIHMGNSVQNRRQGLPGNSQKTSGTSVLGEFEPVPGTRRSILDHQFVTSSPLRYGDLVHLTFELALPADLVPGSYRLLFGRADALPPFPEPLGRVLASSLFDAVGQRPLVVH